MKTKETFKAVVACILCSLLLLTGCAQGSKTKEAGNQNTQTVQANSLSSEANTFPVVKDKITLKVLTQQTPQIQDINTNEQTKHMEEKTNIHVEWQIVPSQDMKQKINLLLASKTDLPDIFMTYQIDNMQLVIYGDQKVFIPLNNYIEKFGVNFKEMCAESNLQNVQAMLTAPDGNIYGLPKLVESIQNEYQFNAWITRKWLDKLGLKMPETTDELYNVLKAFKERDPNGNGKNDEIPFVGAKNGANIPEYFLMCPFIYDDPNYKMTLNNGKVDVPFNKPEWKEGLKYMNRLSREKLLDNVSFTQDVNQLKQLVENKDVELVGVVTGQGPNNFSNANGPRAQGVDAIPPLKGPSGTRTAARVPNNPITRFVITSACKYPEVAFRWGDYLLSEEMSVWARFGVPEKDWVPAKPGEIGSDGKQGTIKPILVWGSVQNSHWYGNSPAYLPEKYSAGQVFDPGVWNQAPILVKNAKAFSVYGPKEVLPPLFMQEKESSEYAELKLLIDNHVTTNLARFVTGDRNIDTDWDKYIKELNDMGLDRYIKMTQAAYDRQYTKK